MHTYLNTPALEYISLYTHTKTLTEAHRYTQAQHIHTSIGRRRTGDAILRERERRPVDYPKEKRIKKKKIVPRSNLKEEEEAIDMSTRNKQFLINSPKQLARNSFAR